MKSKIILVALNAICITASSFAQQGDPKATEFYTPVPKIITPGKNIADAPSDAIILFGGKNLDEWVCTNDTTKAAGWTVAKNILTVKKNTGNIQTKKSFTDYQLHIEWRIPANITGEGQARGNSGIFLASTGSGDAGYEMQVLDCFNNSTYVNGQTASIYKQSIPLANACKKPGEWQVYDIAWTAPRFNEDGTVTGGGDYDFGYYQWTLINNKRDIETLSANNRKDTLFNWTADNQRFTYQRRLNNSFDCTIIFK